jgi:hypothetical protein
VKTLVLTGKSGKNYEFAERPRIPDGPGLFLVTELRGSHPVVIAITPLFGYAVSLEREMNAAIEADRPLIRHAANVLIYPIERVGETLLEVWKDIRRGGAEPLPSFTNREA